MSGTIEAPSVIMGTDIIDNSTGLISPAKVRNLAESAFSIVLSPNGVRTASYTATLTDRGTVVPFNVATGSAGYTIPPHSSVAFANGSALGLLWVSGAAVQPAFVAGVGVTTVSPTGNLTARVVGSVCWAWQYSQDTWYLLGDFT